MDPNKLTKLMTFVLALVLVTAASMSAADHRSAQAPTRVITEGFTAEEHVKQQGELSRTLIQERPSAAPEFRIQLTQEEIFGIDHASRSLVPLRIGLVKKMAPAIEVFGLTRGTPGSQPTQGKSALAVPTSDGAFVWAAVVSANNAGAIRLRIQNMSLPANVELYFYNGSGQAFGPYKGKGPDRSGDFWTATIFGTEATLQLRAAANADVRGITFRVTEVGLITPRFVGTIQSQPLAPAAAWPCGDPTCVVDASCSGAPASLKQAVAKMEWVQGAFIYTCTGGLINDLNPSQSNFFLTANHCLSKNNTAKNVNFYWKFATSSCDGTCPSNNGWPYQTSGATVSVSGKKGDFTLLHLNSNPPAGSVFLGWSTTAVANTNNADLDRVSNPDFGPQVYSHHRVDTSAPTCAGWPRGERIYSRDTTGAIDGGSSGSPIVNSSGQIVGQLSGTCGSNPNDPCSSGPGEANATVDGAFAFYFNSVQPFLNP